MNEENFIPLPAQPSIYSVVNIAQHLLIGSGNNGKIYIYNKSTCRLEELILPDLSPKLADQIEIISIDGFEENGCLVLAVAYLHRSLLTDSDETRTFHLSFYSTIWSTTDSISTLASPSKKGTDEADEVELKLNQLHLIGQNSNSIKTFRLPFTPYHLYHASVQRSDTKFVNVFLMSGSDRSIHLYEIDDENKTFLESIPKKYFPEIPDSFNSIVTRIQIESINERRFTIFGCEDGTLQIFTVTSPLDSSISYSAGSKLKRNANVENKESNIIGATPSEYQLSEEEELSSSPFLIEKLTHYYDGLITGIQFYNVGHFTNLVVTSALSPSYVYLNIVEHNFKSGNALKFSNKWDSIQALCIADVNFDGQYEIIIGTYGCTLLVYKLIDNVWIIASMKQFPTGIFYIEYTECGQLYVVSGSGLHLISFDSDSMIFSKIKPQNQDLSKESTSLGENEIIEATLTSS